MKNRGFGIIQLLVTIVILATVGMLAYKSYFNAGQKAINEPGEVYHGEILSPQPVQNAGVKAESVHARKAKELEGKVFINSVTTAERTYEAVNGKFLYTAWTSDNKELGINTRGNRYFKQFAVDRKAGGGFIVKVRGSGELEGVVLTSE